MRGGGGGAGPAFGPAPFLLGGVGAAKGLLPCFLVPTRNQPTACTLALWWLKFGPTEGGGGGGAAREPLPLGPRQTQALPPPSPSGQRCGCLRRCTDQGGRGPHTALVRRRVLPPGVIRAPLRRAGAGSPVGRDPCGSRRRGALGLAACGSSCVPPPRRGSFWGRGGVPSAPGGERGGGGWGGRSAAPRPLAPSGVGLSSFVSGAPPWGIPVPWGLPGGRGRRSRPVRPPVGQCGGGGGREGGSDLLALVRAPAFPSPASEWAALFAASWAPPFRGRSLAGNAGACGRLAGGLGARLRLPRPRCTPPWVQRPPRVVAGPLCLRSASVRSWAGGGGGGRGGPSGPLLPPPDGRGEAAWQFRPRGASRRLAGPLFSRSPLPCESRTLVQAPSWAPCSPCRRRAALAGWGRP